MGILERKTREKEKRRDEILTAAKKVFFSKDLQTATMDEIAEIAELSKGTLYLYFNSKDELYLSLLSDGTKIFFEMLNDSITANMNTETKLRTSAETYYNFFINHNHYFHIMFLLHNGKFSNGSVSTELHLSSINQSNNILKFLENIFYEGIQSGEFRQTDPWKMAVYTWSISTGIFSILSEKEHREIYGNLDIKEMLDFSMDRIIENLKE